MLRAVSSLFDCDVLLYILGSVSFRKWWMCTKTAIGFMLRSLTVTEINYSQIGKEALVAVVFRVTNVRYFNPDIDHKSSEITKSLL